MIKQYIDFFVGQLLPNLFLMLDSLMIAENVSFLGLVIAVILLCIVIGSVLMRV